MLDLMLLFCVSSIFPNRSESSSSFHRFFGVDVQVVPGGFFKKETAGEKKDALPSI